MRVISYVESIGDLVLGVEGGHLLTGKVRSIIGDGVGELEAIHYMLLEKPDNLLPDDFVKRHYLDSFGEVVGSYQ